MNEQNSGIKNNAQMPNGVPGISKLKFLFVCNEALSGDLAWHITREGHEVKMYIRDKEDADVYNGFVEKVDDWKSWQDWADVIVFDDVEFGPIADKLRKSGKLVVGGSEYTDRLEMDRDFGQNEMKKYGIPVLPHQHFSDYDEAVRFIKENPGQYVFKPSGNINSLQKSLLFVSEEENGSDLVEMLEKNKNVWQKKAPLFLLQQYVSGVEIAAGAFFNGNEFVMPVNINFEHKRLFPGELGPFTGELGTMMYWTKKNRLFEEVLGKMAPALREAGYVGYIDVNSIVNGSGIHPLEFTSRFGYPTIHIQQEGILTPMGEFLWRLAKGESFELRTKRGFQIGVCILIPPSFFAEGEGKETINAYHDLPILFKNPKNMEGIHIDDVKIEDGVWRVAGISGFLFVITSSAKTVAEARRKAYARVRNIHVQNMFYRTDIGFRWFEDSDKLQTWGYL